MFACLGEFQAGLRWVFARAGELGLCAESALALSGGRLVRDARMHRMESTSGGSARLKAVPRRPAWEEDQEGCGAVMCGARKRRGRPGLAPVHRVPLGCSLCAVKRRTAGRMAPARALEGRGLETAGSRPVGPGERAGVGRASGLPLGVCVSGGAPGFRRAVGAAPACALEREDPVSVGGQPLFLAHSGPGQGKWLAEVGRAR